MKQFSASALKGHTRQGDPLPKPGSRLRQIYDLFYEYRGRAIPRAEALRICAGKMSYLAAELLKLTDIYGCDIRKFERRGPETTTATSCLGNEYQTPRWRRDYVLVGEWCGKAYLDYTKPADLHPQHSRPAPGA